ncbi:MAG: hypothetical protein ACOC04_02925 [Halothece sp.]
MSESISIITRTADQSRKANVELPVATRISQVLDAAQQEWNLPQNDYAARLERTNEELDPNSDLVTSGIKNNDVIEIYPILEAGLK